MLAVRKSVDQKDNGVLEREEIKFRNDFHNFSLILSHLKCCKASSNLHSV